jgi:hypothetical protein
MDKIQEITQWFKLMGFEIFLMIAGFMGALVNVSRDKNLTIVEKALTVVSGGLIANYITPLILDWIKAGESARYGMAFIMGYMGLKSVEFAIDWLHRKRPSKEEENN